MHPSRHAAVNPQKPAAIFASGRILRYGELDAKSNQVAQLLRRHGITAGTPVVIFMENEPSYLELMWGLQRSGALAVPVSARLLADEVAYIIRDCGARLMFASLSLEAVARAAADATALPLFIVSGDEQGSYEHALRDMPPTPIADERAGTEMVYSSGTTGRPKGVKPVMPDGPIDAPIRLMIIARDRYEMDSDTIYLSPAPLYHAAPLKWVMLIHRLGGTAVVMEHFNAEQALHLIERYRVSHAQFVPTHFSRMLALPAEIRERFDSSSLRLVLHAAAPCPRNVKEAMLAWWGPIIHEYYAGSEGNGITIASPDEWLSHKGTVGRPYRCEVKICGPDGEPLPPRTEGLVYFAGGAQFEYHNDPEKTAASRNQYGWSTMGDIGWLDEDGFLYLTDRRHFMIISGGVNIYPQEIEDALLNHPAVADAAVIGTPHPDLGEQVTAVIQPISWDLAGVELAQDLRTYLRQHLSPVKVPKRLDFLKELPRLPTGKLLKRILRDAYFEKNPEVAAAIKSGYSVSDYK
jgi:long-chain acyl-CoA synthetase